MRRSLPLKGRCYRRRPAGNHHTHHPPDGRRSKFPRFYMSDDTGCSSTSVPKFAIRLGPDRRSTVWPSTHRKPADPVGLIGAVPARARRLVEFTQHAKHAARRAIIGGILRPRPNASEKALAWSSGTANSLNGSPSCLHSSFSQMIANGTLPSVLTTASPPSVTGVIGSPAPALTHSSPTSVPIARAIAPRPGLPPCA